MATKTPTPVRDTRIDTTTWENPNELRTYFRNARRGDIPAIARSLKRLQQYKPITVNVGTHTGRPNEVLAGNHTLLAIRHLADEQPDNEAWQKVKVHWGDWDDEQCRLINVADNRTAELGGYDTEELLALLTDVPSTDLSSIGYTSDDLAALEASLIPELPGPRGTGDKTALWGATVGDPPIDPEHGSIWKMGHHTVYVGSLHKDWEKWQPLLKPGMIFAPYPSLMLPYMDAANETPMLMIQPDRFIAGWLLTKWGRVYPDDPAVAS